VTKRRQIAWFATATVLTSSNLFLGISKLGSADTRPLPERPNSERHNWASELLTALPADANLAKRKNTRIKTPQNDYISRSYPGVWETREFEKASSRISELCVCVVVYVCMYVCMYVCVCVCVCVCGWLVGWLVGWLGHVSWQFYSHDNVTQTLGNTLPHVQLLLEIDTLTLKTTGCIFHRVTVSHRMPTSARHAVTAEGEGFATCTSA